MPSIADKLRSLDDLKVERKRKYDELVVTLATQEVDLDAQAVESLCAGAGKTTAQLIAEVDNLTLRHAAAEQYGQLRNAQRAAARARVNLQQVTEAADAEFGR